MDDIVVPRNGDGCPFKDFDGECWFGGTCDEAVWRKRTHEEQEEYDNRLPPQPGGIAADIRYACRANEDFIAEGLDNCFLAPRAQQKSLSEMLPRRRNTTERTPMSTIAQRTAHSRRDQSQYPWKRRSKL